MSCTRPWDQVIQDARLHGNGVHTSAYACIYNSGSFFLRKSDYLAVLLCLLASFFLPSHLSFKNMYI